MIVCFRQNTCISYVRYCSILFCLVPVVLFYLPGGSMELGFSYIEDAVNENLFSTMTMTFCCKQHYQQRSAMEMEE